jgi:hypothetical protein
MVNFAISVSEPGRAVADDDWEIIDPLIIAAWQAAAEHLAKMDIIFDGHEIFVEFNWSSVISDLEKDLVVKKALYAATSNDEYMALLKKFPLSQTQIHGVTRTISPESPASRAPNPMWIVESLLHDVYLIMNLSQPASSNFDNAVVRRDDETATDKLKLSGFWFEMVLLRSLRGKWPPVKSIPVPLTSKWFKSVRSGVSQTPRNQTEKVLFSMLHISLLDSSPVVVIWIFYALETLFDTRPGENFRTLIERISLLLKPDTEQLAMLRKNMREMYDMRSSFVHGGL